MYHPPSKRIRFWRRFAAVSVMAVAVVAGVAILTALTLGYGFSQKDGRIEQGGLLQMGSVPSGAALTINGTPFGAETPTKLVSQPGEYALTMQKKGYQTWQKTVPIQAGNITWVTYPRLIPQKLDPEQTLTYPATTVSALASGSAKRYGIVPAPDKPVVSVAQLDSDKVVAKEYTLPPDIYTPAAEQSHPTFAIEAWTGDEKKLLLQHVYNPEGAVEWILFDLGNPSASVNINRALGISGTIKKPAFTRDDGMELYASVDGSVRVLDLADQTLSHPLVDHVTDFRLYGDEFVLFAKEPTDGMQEVGYVRKDYKQPRILKKVPYNGTTTAQLDISKYYDKYYFLISHANEAELLSSSALPDDPTSQLTFKHVQTLMLPQPVIDANLTDNGQFATIQDGTSFSTFNLEIMQLTKTTLTHGTSAVPQKLKYLDGYTLWGSNDGKLHTYEFDGANQHDIMPLLPELGATLSPNGKYLYGFSQIDSKTIALSRVQLLDIKTE